MQHHSLRSMLGILLVAAVAGTAWGGTTGKIRGKITDKANGEGLVGASIVIQTTTMGATSDVNGEFTILNVPPGVYSVQASYVGYETVKKSNVRVTVDLTTVVDFSPESQPIPGPTIEIVVQAPLVNRSATNFVTTVGAEQIEQLPVRSIGDIFALSAGVVQQGGNYYVRGGREEETAFYVDGVLVNNPLTGQIGLNVISNAIEEVQTQIGGMTAQYGNAMSGVVNATTKTGGAKYSASFEALTDQLGGTTSKNVFGAYSYGLSEYNATIGGPILPNDNRFRFFVAGQRIFNRSAASFLSGIGLPFAVDSTAFIGADWRVVDRHASSGNYVTAPAGTTGNRTYLANLLNETYAGGRNMDGVDRDSYAFNGNILADFDNVNVKIGGSYDRNKQIGSFNGQAVNTGGSTFIQSAEIGSGLGRPSQTIVTDASLYVKLTHFLDPETYYTLQGNYFSYKSTTGDEILWNNIEAYGNPDRVPTLVGPSRNPPFASIYSFSVEWPGTIRSGFSKLERDNLGGRFDFTRQFGPTWEFRAGAELNRYTIRSYGISAVSIALARINAGAGASDWTVYNNSGLSTYGYDIYGNEFNGGSFTDKTGKTVDLSDEGPRHPVFFGGYLQNKFEFDDLIINLGLRYDFFDPAAPQYRDLQDIPIDSYDGVPVVADSAYGAKRVTYNQFSPRIGFSFPVADKSVFHATFGRFMQMGRLSDLYISRMTAGSYFASGYAVQLANPNLKPERTTDYEVGFRQQVGDEASFDMSFFYKDTKDLHVLRVIFPYNGAAYYLNENGDFGTTKGVTLNFQMRRTRRVALNASYTLSNSTATGSSSGTDFDIAWQDNSYGGRPYFPVIPAPTAFDRTHTGNINLDYRFDKDDGPTLFNTKILERAGLDVLFTFSSGIRYTLSQVDGAFTFSSTNAPQAYESFNNSMGPWIYQVDLKLDKTVAVFGNLDLNIYLWVSNLFDRKNAENGIYQGTGQTLNDGFLATAEGKTWAANNGPNAVKMYQYLEENLGFYGPPRQVRLGLRLDI
jgi:outer membrane receptor protein involved in Fe transport